MSKTPFVDALVQESLPIWQQCLDSDFLRGLEAGSWVLLPAKAMGPSSFFMAALLSAFKASSTIRGLSLNLRVK